MEDGVDYPCSALFLDHYERYGLSDGLPEEFWREVKTETAGLTGALPKLVQTLLDENKRLHAEYGLVRSRLSRIERDLYGEGKR